MVVLKFGCEISYANVKIAIPVIRSIIVFIGPGHMDNSVFLFEPTIRIAAIVALFLPGR
jgi:hypothetical protein